MSTVETKDLFNDSSYPRTVKEKLYLIIYTPVAIILLLIRISIGLVAILLASALPDTVALRNAVSRLVSFSLGVIVEVQNIERRDKNAKLIICNHISRLDHLALHTATGSVLPTKYKMQGILENALGLLYHNSTLSHDFIAHREEPVLVFPEETMTNGHGLLKFKTHVFSLETKIQPLTLRAIRPAYANFPLKSLGSDWWFDMFKYLFVPYTIYTVTYLPVVEKNNSTETEFAERVREVIANDLKIPLTSINNKDMAEHEKRYCMEQSQSRVFQHIDNTLSAASYSSSDPMLTHMAHQVREVLPNVPLNVIIQDLAKTGRVDITISNILEGHVIYTPETSASTSQSTQSSTNVSTITSGSCKPLSTAALSFPKSANERMRSFQERKSIMIENARERYIAKHGLKGVINN